MVYAVGIPVGIGIAVAFKTPIVCREGAGHSEADDMRREERDRRSVTTIAVDEGVTALNPLREPAVGAIDGVLDGLALEGGGATVTTGAAAAAEVAATGAERQKKKKKAACKPRWRCRRRARADYHERGIRRRFGFLFHGLSVDRSGVIVAWEMMVMFQKLFVTLAGSTISDPYLQILSALLILIISFGLLTYVVVALAVVFCLFVGGRVPAERGVG